jgi:two-component system, chemotaxis family, chemotaxis protein CheY
MRLLIVEDSELIRKVTRLAFPTRQHELHEAENGRKALEILAGSLERFDAIVLDLQMPDMNGVEFLRELRHRPRHATTPIVVATSEADDSPLLQDVLQLGVTALLKKPWKPQELAATVQRAYTQADHGKGAGA